MARSAFHTKRGVPLTASAPHNRVMSEFDELVSRHGVLMAGRFGPDWRVAESPDAATIMGYIAAHS